MIHVYIVAQWIPAKSEWMGLWQNVNQGIAALYSKPQKKKNTNQWDTASSILGHGGCMGPLDSSILFMKMRNRVVWVANLTAFDGLDLDH